MWPYRLDIRTVVEGLHPMIVATTEWLPKAALRNLIPSEQSKIGVTHAGIGRRGVRPGIESGTG